MGHPRTILPRTFILEQNVPKFSVTGLFVWDLKIQGTSIPGKLKFGDALSQNKRTGTDRMEKKRISAVGLLLYEGLLLKFDAWLMVQDTGLWGIYFVTDAYNQENMVFNIAQEWMRLCTSLTEFEVG